MNPLVTSMKKDGSLRICLDARRLYDIRVNFYECVKPTEVLFERSSDNKMISIMDLTRSFWQIALAEK